MRLKTRIILILFFFAVGAGTGYAWRSNIFVPTLDNEDATEVAEKQRAVKPDNLKKRLKDVVPAPKIENDFTFFDTLSDVSQSRFVDLDGSIVEKQGYQQEMLDDVEDEDMPDAQVESPVVEAVRKPEAPKTPAPVKLVQQDSAKSLEEKIKELEALVEEEPETQTGPSESVPSPHVNPPQAGTLKSDESGGPRYRVQVSSFREVERARALESTLQEKGYPAFYQAVTLPGDSLWYRVFLGEYSDRSAAEDAARRAQLRHQLDTVILTIR